MLPSSQLVHCLIKGAVVAVAAVPGAVVTLQVEQRVGQVLQVWLVLLYQVFEGQGLHIFIVRSNASFTGQEGLH